MGLRCFAAFILLLCPAKGLFAFTKDPDCNKIVQPQNKVNCLINKAKVTYKTKDITSLVTELENMRVSYRLAGVQLSYDEASLSAWQKESYKPEIIRLNKQAEFLSHFRPPTIELVKINRLKKLINDNTPDTRSTAYSAVGENSLEIEKLKCTPVDNRNDSIGEVRNQDSMGWCYAFAAADLISHKTGQRVSALGIGLKYNEIYNYFDSLLTGVPTALVDGGGYISKALKINSTTGLCLEEELKSDDYAFSKLKELLISTESLTKPGLKATGNPNICPAMPT